VKVEILEKYTLNAKAPLIDGLSLARRTLAVFMMP
jgi:hypothetical protein